MIYHNGQGTSLKYMYTLTNQVRVVMWGYIGSDRHLPRGVNAANLNPRYCTAGIADMRI